MKGKKCSFFGHLQGDVEISLGMGILCEYMGRWRRHGAFSSQVSWPVGNWERVFSSSINSANSFPKKKVAQGSASYASWTHLWGGVLGMSTRRGPRGKTQGTSLWWPGNTLGSHQESWSKYPGRGKSGPLCLDCCPHDPAVDEAVKTDGWNAAFSFTAISLVSPNAIHAMIRHYGWMWLSCPLLPYYCTLKLFLCRPISHCWFNSNIGCMLNI